MSEDQREGWLAELEPGDEVCVEVCESGVYSRTFDEVERITPTGRLIVDGTTYNPNGCQRGRKYGYRWVKLKQPTEELRREARLKTIRRRLDSVNDSVNWRKVNDEVVLAVYEMLREAAEND